MGSVIGTVERTARFCAEHSLLREGETVLLAVSGGADSMALLEAFGELGERLSLTLRVAHLNHCLRGQESDDDAAFVADQARMRDIPVTIGRTDVPKRRIEAGGSLEAVARDVRYAFLEETAQSVGATKIALAHHQDDLAETFLLQLLRGAGSRGLSSLRPIRDGKWIRPLLPFSKDELLAFLADRGVPYREDASNTDRRFRRNRIRHELLPSLEHAYNPRIRQTLAQTATLLEAEDDLLRGLTDEAEVRIIHENDALAIMLLNAEPLAIRRRLLHRWLERALPGGRMPTFAEVEAARRFAASGDRRFLSLTRSIRLVRRDGLLVAESPPTSRTEKCAVEIAAPGETFMDGLTWGIFAEVVDSREAIDDLPPTEAAFDWERIPTPLTLRRWREGDRFQPFGMAGTKSVGDFLSDAKVSRDDRRRVGVVCAGGEILWVVGFRADGRFSVTDTTRRILRLKVVPVWDGRGTDENLLPTGE